jgi:hypothetical protein
MSLSNLERIIKEHDRNSKEEKQFSTLNKKHLKKKAEIDTDDFHKNNLQVP